MWRWTLQGFIETVWQPSTAAQRQSASLAQVTEETGSLAADAAELRTLLAQFDTGVRAAGDAGGRESATDRPVADGAGST